MNREPVTITQPVAVRPTSVQPVEAAEPASATVAEDSNNNTSLVDRERTADATSETNSASTQHSPSVREIHKNSWLKKMPCIDKWSGKFPKAQKLEKFWVVFCVHDDIEAFLEFYENRRSAYSHIPLSSVSLSKCLHISPTIVAQGNDHEFVITLDTQVIRLAASTNEQMLEWMDTLSTKLREMGVLEPKDNLYSKEPITSRPTTGLGYSDSQSREDFSRLSLRDPNSPLPPVPSQPPEDPSSNPTVVYIRNPSVLRVTTPTQGSTRGSITIEAMPEHTVPESIFSFDVSGDRPVSTSSHESSSPLLSPTNPPDQAIASSSADRTSSTTEQTSITAKRTSLQGKETSSTSTSTPEQTTLYEPLFYGASSSVGLSIRSNPSYENPPQPTRHIIFKPTPALPPRPTGDSRRASGDVASIPTSSRLNNLVSASEPSLASSSQSPFTVAEPSSSASAVSPPVALLRTHSQVEPSERPSHMPLGERHPHNGPRRQSTSSFKSGTIPVDENGKPISLREAQVQKLQSEISHKSGVRLMLRKKDCLNAIAFVEFFNHVWVAGWKQKEHPLLHNTFHVGDRIISISGQRILNVQDAHKAIKQQPSTVEFIVRRLPYAKIFAIKREYEGQDLGIVREGGTAEIKEVKASGIASRQGLLARSTSLDGTSFCNWVLTEINHRPLNLFFKDNEIQDRLNAVGLDISLLVQPVELVKALKKQLKTIRGYKDYIVQ
ncbi:hypothetical protein JTE90_008295 [Oedothorax gibbosus]|uniref:PH domain-containing protein n=1 Tax=Oedothorax gibbosus TaxID=931172 RepID=A0AAV6UI28_9ARAC|nr:hypothetical protein JTE90_008295 [Oedothorax gibbosus]